MVFGSFHYAASGGLNDVTSDFDNKEDAVKEANRIEEHYVHVFDRVEGAIIFEGENKPKGVINRVNENLPQLENPPPPPPIKQPEPIIR